MSRKFHIRDEDRRKENSPVSLDRREGSRRSADRRPRGRSAAQLQRGLRGLEELLGGIESDLAAVRAAHDSGETSQIPTRNPLLAGAVRQLSEAQAALLELVRAAQGAGLLTAQLRGWAREVGERAGEVEDRLAAHMAERLGIGRPAIAPRARRLLGRLERLLG